MPSQQNNLDVACGHLPKDFALIQGCYPNGRADKITIGDRGKRKSKILKQLESVITEFIRLVTDKRGIVTDPDAQTNSWSWKGNRRDSRDLAWVSEIEHEIGRNWSPPNKVGQQKLQTKFSAQI